MIVSALTRIHHLMIMVSSVSLGPGRASGDPSGLQRVPQKPHNPATRRRIPTGAPLTIRHTPVHSLRLLKVRRMADDSVDRRELGCLAVAGEPWGQLGLTRPGCWSFYRINALRVTGPLKNGRSAVCVPLCPGAPPHLLHHHIGTASEDGSNLGLLVTGSRQHGCFAVVKIARHRGYPRADRALQSAGRSRCQTHGQRPCVQSVPGGEGLETGPLVSRGPLCRMEPPVIGQGGPHQVDGPAQVRVGLRLEAIGAGQAPVDLVLGWSQCRHHPEGAVHAPLVGAVTTAPGLRRTANAGGELGVVRFHLHGVAAEGGTERQVALGDDGIPIKRRRLVVLVRLRSA